MREAADRGRQKRTNEAKAKKEAYLLNPVICLNCENKIEYSRRLTNKYCCRSCTAKHLKFGGAIKGPKQIKFCIGCGDKLKSGNKFCSVKCQQKQIRDKLINQWLAGEINPSTARGCSVTIRKYLLDQCNHKCPKCGWGEIHPVTDNVPLEINHIDGIHTNNSPENLEVLCPNCHSLTPNFRALNKGQSTRPPR